MEYEPLDFVLTIIINWVSSRQISQASFKFFQISSSAGLGPFGILFEETVDGKDSCDLFPGPEAIGRWGFPPLSRCGDPTWRLMLELLLLLLLLLRFTDDDCASVPCFLLLLEVPPSVDGTAPDPVNNVDDVLFVLLLVGGGLVMFGCLDILASSDNFCGWSEPPVLEEDVVVDTFFFLGMDEADESTSGCLPLRLLLSEAFDVLLVEI